MDNCQKWLIKKLSGYFKANQYILTTITPLPPCVANLLALTSPPDLSAILNCSFGEFHEPPRLMVPAPVVTSAVAIVSMVVAATLPGQ